MCIVLFVYNQIYSKIVKIIEYKDLTNKRTRVEKPKSFKILIVNNKLSNQVVML